MGGGDVGVAVGGDLGVRGAGGAEEDSGAGGGGVVAQVVAVPVAEQVDAPPLPGECEGGIGPGDAGADDGY